MPKCEAKKGDFAKIWEKLGGGGATGPPAPPAPSSMFKCQNCFIGSNGTSTQNITTNVCKPSNCEYQM